MLKSSTGDMNFLSHPPIPKRELGKVWRKFGRNLLPESTQLVRHEGCHFLCSFPHPARKANRSLFAVFGGLEGLMQTWLVDNSAGLDRRRSVGRECELQATVVSLDGRCEYDCISRDASFRKVHEVAPTLVPHHPHRPFLYPRPSVYYWCDKDGVRHGISEQGAFWPRPARIGQWYGLQRADASLANANLPKLS